MDPLVVSCHLLTHSNAPATDWNESDKKTGLESFVSARRTLSNTVTEIIRILSFKLIFRKHKFLELVNWLNLLDWSDSETHIPGIGATLDLDECKRSGNITHRYDVAWYYGTIMRQVTMSDRTCDNGKYEVLFDGENSRCLHSLLIEDYGPSQHWVLIKDKWVIIIIVHNESS